MLLLSAAAVAAAPLADAEERTIQLTEAEKQEIQAANEKLLAFLTERGHTKFRAQQVLDWIWRKRVTSSVSYTHLHTGTVPWKKTWHAFRP